METPPPASPATPRPSDTPAPELHPPAFTPVPSTSNRHDGWTAERQARFIVLLTQTGVVAFAARGIGMSHASAYKLRTRPGAESFARAWDIAVDMARDRIFEQACDRAVNGIAVPLYYRGRQVGTRHRFDYRLAMSALRDPTTPPFAPLPDANPAAKLKT